MIDVILLQGYERIPLTPVPTARMCEAVCRIVRRFSERKT